MARIRDRFLEPTRGRMRLAIEEVAAGEALTFPVYDDITTVDDPDRGARVHLTGDVQQPAGVWWHDGEQWYSGTRLTTSAVREEVGSQESRTLAEVAVPAGMEIDIWQAQVAVVDGDEQDVAMDVYSADTDDVVFSHDFQEHGAEPHFGSPIGVFGVGGELLEFRVTNNDPGTLEISGYVIWSFQTVTEY